MTAIEVSLFNQGRFMIFSRGKRSATGFLTPSGKKLPLKNLKSSIFPRLKFEKNLYCQLKDEYKSYKQLLLNLTIFYTVSQKKVWLAASGAKIANFHFTILQIFCDYVIQYYIFDFLNFWVWEKKSFRKVRKVKKFEQPQTNRDLCPNLFLFLILSTTFLLISDLIYQVFYFYFLSYIIPSTNLINGYKRSNK